MWKGDVTVKVTRVLFAVLVLVLTTCTPSYPRPPKVTELQLGKWTKIEPGGDTRCVDNTPYAFWVRPGTENKLLIYFQGGGMCWDADSCSQENLYDHTVTDADNPENLRGIFCFCDGRNPFASYNVVFIPYCTGDLHWGNYVATYTVDGTPVPIYHRGYVNAHSALRWVSENYSAPTSIFVTGGSAGSVGSILHAAHIAKHYPDSMVTQLGDSAAVSPPLDFDTAYGAHQNFPDCQKLDEFADDGLEVWEIYAAVAHCNHERTFSQFNFASDHVQKFFYYKLGGTGTFDGLIEDHLRKTREQATNFYSYTVLNDIEADHCILTKKGFYELKVGGTLLRDWVQELAVRGTVTSNISGTATIDLGP
jgi:hypothetical protein